MTWYRVDRVHVAKRLPRDLNEVIIQHTIQCVMCSLSAVQYVHKAELASGRACAPCAKELHSCIFPSLMQFVFPEHVPYGLAMNLF